MSVPCSPRLLADLTVCRPVALAGEQPLDFLFLPCFTALVRPRALGVDIVNPEPRSQPLRLRQYRQWLAKGLSSSGRKAGPTETSRQPMRQSRDPSHRPAERPAGPRPADTPHRSRLESGQAPVGPQAVISGWPRQRCAQQIYSACDTARDCKSQARGCNRVLTSPDREIKSIGQITDREAQFDPAANAGRSGSDGTRWTDASRSCQRRDTYRPL